jgi:hypothetical protein
MPPPCLLVPAPTQVTTQITALPRAIAKHGVRPGTQRADSPRAPAQEQATFHSFYLQSPYFAPRPQLALETMPRTQRQGGLQ